MMLTVPWLSKKPPPPQQRGQRGQGERRAPLAGFAQVLRDSTFRRYTVIVCAIYCAWFVYLTQSPFVFAGLGLREAQSGWLYLPLTASIIAANLLARR